ncbi:MAG: O-antigen ligase family protein, partial [Lachnospiraceae bacterium]|nr:O-antigen ligase family protein [Lachnospiraceae bacterium]
MREKYRESFGKFCFANCITFGGLVNIILLYTGIGFVSNAVRRVLFIGALLVFMAISICCLLTKRHELKLPNKTILILIIFISYYVYGILYSFIEFGLTSTWMGYVTKLIVMSLPCLIFGIIGGKENMAKDFLPYLEKGSIVVVPIAVYYAVVHWFGIANMDWDYGKAVGPLGYMYLAGMFMPYMLAHMLSFLFEGERKIEWFKCQLPLSQIWRVVFTGVYWIAILASGTRGIMLSSVFSMIIMVLVKLFWKSGIKQIWLPLSAILIALFLGFVWSPKGMSEGGIHRWSAVLDGLKEGRFTTNSEEVFESEEQVQDFINEKNNKVADNNRTDDANNGDNDAAEGNNLENTSPESDEELIESESLNTQVNDIDINQLAREELFKLAIEEFKRHPIIGIGPMVYSIKYEEAPHAIILEVLCETGIVGAIIYIGVIIYVLILWVFRRKKNSYEVAILCFLSAYMLELNISGYLWIDAAPVVFAIAFGMGMI